MEKNIATVIRDRITEKEAGSIITTRDFDDIHNDKIVLKTLSRMSLEGKIDRIARSLYIIPKTTKFGKLNPSLDDIAHSIAKKQKIHIIPTGDTALNILGISTQIPMKAIYLTNGSKKQYKIGNREIIFKHVEPKNFLFKSSLIALINVALKQLGKENFNKEVDDKLKDHLATIDANDTQVVLDDISLSPGWIKEILFTILKERNK